MSADLDPLTPVKGRRMYLNERRDELAVSTHQSYGYRLKQFVDWCEEGAIENLNTISGRDIHRFSVKRRDEDGLAPASMKGEFATLQLFLRFCASIDAVQPGLDEKTILPTTTAEVVRYEIIRSDRAQKILNHLNQYRYDTLSHSVLEVMWHAGLRVGATVSLDVEDYDASEQYLKFVHRPEQGTALKMARKVNGTSR